MDARFRPWRSRAAQTRLIQVLIEEGAADFSGTRPSACMKCKLMGDNFLKERFTVTSQTCLPSCTWFLVNDGGRPMGQIRRAEIPEVGVIFGVDGRFEEVEVVEVVELRPTCSMRRFRVIARVIR